MLLKKCLICLLSALFLTAIAAPAAMAAGNEEEPIARIIELKQDISMLNLLNGLHLTKNQHSAILEEARNAHALREEYRQRAAHLIAQTEERLEGLRAELISPELPPPRYVENRAKKANSEIKEIQESYLLALGRIEQRVSAILTDGQKQIVEDFKPCLIPPKNLRNPTRAGQANDSSRVERLLSRSRTIPSPKFERKMNVYFDKHIEKLEKYGGPMSDEKIEAERERVLAIVKEARALSDVDFELNKQELARRIDTSEENKKKALLLSHGTRRGKIARFLLSERIIPILEERIIVASAPSNRTSIRLDSIKPAEDCRERCGPNQMK